MPLNEEQIRERRNMGRDATLDQDLFRIAEALERLADSVEATVPTLRKIEEHLGLASQEM